MHTQPPKSFTAIDGKRIRIDPRLPTQEVRWLVNRRHIMDPAHDVAADICARAQHWPERIRLQAIAYALRVHADNAAAFTRHRF